MQPLPTNLCDIDATRMAYTRDAGARCDCAYCRNLGVQLGRILAPAADAMRAIGIDPYAPGEIVELGRTPQGLRYQVEWPLIARDGAPASPGAATIDGLAFTWRPGGVPAPAFDASGRRWSLCLDLVDVPWVMHSPIPDP